MTRGSARARHERRSTQARPHQAAAHLSRRIGLIALTVVMGAGLVLVIGSRLLRSPSINTPATLGAPDHWQRIADGSTIDDELMLGDGSAWALFTDGYVGRLDGDHWTPMSDRVSGSLLIELPGTPPRLLVVGGVKTAWLTADQGKSWQSVDLPLDLPTTFTAPNVSQQTALWLVGHNPPDPKAIWLATYDELAHYDPDSARWQLVTVPSGWQLALSNAVVAADGSIWVGAYRAVGAGTAKNNGANGLPTAWWRYSPGPALKATPALSPIGNWAKSAYMPRDSNAFVFAPNGATWLILDDDQLALLPPNLPPDQVANWQIPPPLMASGSNQPVAVDSGAADRDGIIWWIDRSGGLYAYDGKNWQIDPVGSTNIPMVHPVPPFVTDHDGHLWLGGDHLARFADGHWIIFDPARADIFNTMQKVYQDVSGRPLARDGSLWIAVSAAGLVRYGDGNWTWFGPQNNALPMPANAGISDKYVPLSSAPDGSMLVYHPIEGATYRYRP